MRRVTVGLGLVALLVAACTGDGGLPGVFQPEDEDVAGPEALGDPGDCVTVDMAVSSEKIDLLTDLARVYNASDEARVGDRCVFVRPYSKASGGAMTLLSEGWPDPEVDGPPPVIWSPAASTWGVILNQLRADGGFPPMAPPSRPFMLTPLVIAMPKPMADALGYPQNPVGWDDVLRLAKDPEGWGSVGHPEWGPFRLGKTNPNFSTSGLAALIAQYYAATGKVRGLTIEDLGRQDVIDFAVGVESAVVHYGDTTLTFLNNMARADARGTVLSYASAVAIEEVSLVHYNQGNPDGVLEPGEVLVVPRVPLVGVYPKEGTLFSDNPFIILDADWVTDEQKEAARGFEAFVQGPENQERVLEFGFRPGNPEVALGPPLTPDLGIDVDQPQTTLEVPEPSVMVEVLRRWEEQRKPARVLLVMDVSGSMADFVGGERQTKLDLAVDAAVHALDQFRGDDEVGLRIFSTNLGPGQDQDWIDVVPLAPMAQIRGELERRLQGLTPVAGTPLYTVTLQSYNELTETADPTRINAVVLLTDGRNEDPRNNDLQGLLAALQEGREGRQSEVRVFTIGYGDDVDLPILSRIAEATDAVAYDSRDPRSIDRVFTAVISNF